MARNPECKFRLGAKSQAQNEAREVLQKMDASGLRYTRLLKEVPLGARISCPFAEEFAIRMTCHV